MLKICISLCLLFFFGVIYSFVQKDSLYFTIARKSVESHLEELPLKTFDTTTKIIKVGDDVTVGCNLCDINLLQWTYKGPNKPQEEIVTSGKAIRTKYQGKNTSWFELVGYPNCMSNLHLTKIQYDAAGIYTCWDNLNKISTTNIVVINDNNNCSSETEFSDFLTQKVSFTIKCSFKYAADESCVVAPVWTDLTGYRNLTLPGDDFEVDMDNLQAWIHFKSGVDILNGIHLNLSFVFNCSSSNNTQDKYEVQSYNFGQIPFTLFAAFEKGTTTTVTSDGSPINRLLTTGIITAIAIFALFLFPVLIWKIFKNYKLINAIEVDASVMGKAIPDIPMIASYSLEHLGAPKLPPRRDIVKFVPPEDATYEVIKD